MKSEALKGPKVDKTELLVTITITLFSYFRNNLFCCFVGAVSDLVHDVEAMFYLPVLRTGSGNLF